MKNLKFLTIGTCLLLLAGKGFGQTNTTYGGATQDGLSSCSTYSIGDITSCPGGTNNTGYGVNTFGPTGNTAVNGNDNTAIGFQTMYNLYNWPAMGIDGFENTATGSQALYSLTQAWGNTADGYRALYYTDGTGSNAAGNTGIGIAALYYNAYGGAVNYQNTGVGAYSLNGNSSSGCGYDNTGIGYNSLRNNYGDSNVAVGLNSLVTNTTGNASVAIGPSTLFYNTASDNVAVGGYTLYKNTSGYRNCGVGYETMYNMTQGYENTAMGYAALASDQGFAGGPPNAFGSQNVAIGAYTLQKLNPSVVSEGMNCTAVGWSALQNFNPNAVDGCTAIGSQASQNDNTGVRNTSVGGSALKSNTSGNDNVAVGSAALSYTTVVADVAVGSAAMEYSEGNDNVAVGYQAMEGGTTATGANNTAVGYKVLRAYTAGKSNSGFGNAALSALTTGDSNTAIGSGTLTNFIQAGVPASTYCWGGNVAVGNGAGGTSNVVKDFDDMFLGIQATKASSLTSANIISNASAIGPYSQVYSSNEMELGNNNVTAAIGLSGALPSGMGTTNLEIATENSPWPNNWNAQPLAQNYYYVAVNPATGTTGLRFHDLNSKSTPVALNNSNFTNIMGVNPAPQGVLSVDGYGNVIYVAPSFTANNGLGYCSSGGLTPMTDNGGYNLLSNAGSPYNFYFAGNGSQQLGVEDVVIGNPCGYTPQAKLDVLQNSGATSTASQTSIGIYVENDDLSAGTQTSPYPVIGLKSYLPPPSGSEFYNVAGWFEADDIDTDSQYAIFVPHYGGIVSVGFNLGTFPTFSSLPALMYVNGGIETGGSYIYSDSTLKKDMTSFNDGIKVIRGLKPINYKYNGVGGLDTRNSYIGLKAQNLASVAPYAVKKSVIKKSDKDGDTSTVLSIYEQAVLYTAINAIKDVDSAVTENHNTETVKIEKQQQVIDSLKTALQSMQTCLNQICSQSSNPNIQGGINGNISNTQEVSLSNADAPLLYQNIPNPFSTSTKINYYLPEGTLGATVIFYDNYGNQLKEVQLSQTGNGTINLNPENLANGVYSYSLVVNGKVIDTKRMILQK